MEPNPSESIIVDDGIVVPMGRLQRAPVDNYLRYNEYIVYNEDQAQIRYLIQVKFVSGKHVM